jgi:hypothetical protein
MDVGLLYARKKAASSAPATLTGVAISDNAGDCAGAGHNIHDQQGSRRDIDAGSCGVARWDSVCCGPTGCGDCWREHLCSLLNVQHCLAEQECALTDKLLCWA